MKVYRTRAMVKRVAPYEIGEDAKLEEKAVYSFAGYKSCCRHANLLVQDHSFSPTATMMSSDGCMVIRGGQMKNCPYCGSELTYEDVEYAVELTD